MIRPHLHCIWGIAFRAVRRQADAYTIAEAIEVKIEAQAWEYLETEAVVNDGTVVILAVKFQVAEAF